MTDCSELEVYYWDVYPKIVKLSLSGSAMQIPLSVRGNPAGGLQFESGDDSIAFVDGDGKLNAGMKEGATVVSIYDSGAKESVRFVQVDVVDYAKAAGE